MLKNKRKLSKKKKIVGGIIGCLVIGGAVFAFKSMSGASSADMVETVKVKKGDVVSTLNVTGDVTSAITKTYFSPVNATISICNGGDGNTVDAGALIIGYDTSTLKQENQKAMLQSTATASGNQDTIAKANQASQRTTRSESEIQADIDARNEQIANLNSLIAERTNELTSNAEQSVTDATIANQNCAAELEDLTGKLKDLQDRLDNSDTELSEEEKANLTQQIAELSPQVEAKKAEAQELNNQMTTVTGQSVNPTTDEQIVAWSNELSQAQSDLSDLQSEKATAESETKAASQAGVTEAAKQQMAAQNNLSELEALSTEQLLAKGEEGMKTEFKGILTDVKVKQGELVTQGQELYTVASNENVYVNVPVSKSDYDKVETGQKAKITIGKKEYQGTVTEISKIAKKTEKGAEVLYTKVRVDNSDNDIYLGVQAKVVVSLGTAKNTVCVDSQAVNSDADGDFCYLIDKDGKVERKNVEIGLSASDFTEIKSGLSEGDVVITKLPDGVEEGSAVIAVEE